MGKVWTGVRMCKCFSCGESHRVPILKKKEEFKAFGNLQGCANVENLNAIRIAIRIFTSHHLLEFKLRSECWQIGRKGTGSSQTAAWFRILFPFLLRKYIGQHWPKTSASVWPQQCGHRGHDDPFRAIFLWTCSDSILLTRTAGEKPCSYCILPLDPSKCKSQNGTAHHIVRTQGALKHFPPFSTGFGDKETRFKEIGWLTSS